MKKGGFSVSKVLVGVGLIFTFHFSLFTSVWAQNPWNFSSLEEACMDDAYFVMPPGDLHKQVSQQAGRMDIYNQSYHLSGPYTVHGKPYIRFQNSQQDFRLPEALAAQLLPHLVSHSYWRQRYNTLQQWSYIDMELLGGLLEADTTDHTYGRYNTIVWLGYEFQPSEETPVYFTVVVGGGVPQRLSLRAMERLAEWGAFASQADWRLYVAQHNDIKRQQQERQEALQQQIDSLANIIAMIEHQADSLVVAMQSDSIAQVEADTRMEVERTKARMNRQELFFMSIRPARSDYMFGLEFNLYNCFSKTISKIEITVTPYNDRGRVQEDRFHRSVRTVRCMGPIRPSAPAQYVFDELFWAEKNNIKYMRVTDITFYFADGTTRNYNGYANIMKHCLK